MVVLNLLLFFFFYLDTNCAGTLSSKLRGGNLEFRGQFAASVQSSSAQFSLRLGTRYTFHNLLTLGNFLQSVEAVGTPTQSPCCGLRYSWRSCSQGGVSKPRNRFLPQRPPAHESRASPPAMGIHGWAGVGDLAGLRKVPSAAALRSLAAGTSHLLASQEGELPHHRWRGWSGDLGIPEIRSQIPSASSYPSCSLTHH